MGLRRELVQEFVKNYRYHNYHKHTHYSNISTIDCVSKPEHYIARALELGHDTYFTTEHGWRGNMHEAQILCEKNNIKPIFGVEAYYVHDMNDKSSRKNNHIILVAMTDSGRKQINTIVSKANVEGFYSKPRIDLKCLLSLNPKDVVVTTACIMGAMFNMDDWENNFLIPVHNHFRDNFFLEVQCHNSHAQIEYNKKLIEISNKYNISLIHANDSHYIYPNESKYRDLFLKGKGINYEYEDSFVLDYPDGKEIVNRYMKQGVLNQEQIAEAISNTLIFDKAEAICIDKKIKLPCINKGENSTKVLRDIINKEIKSKINSIDKDRLLEYREAIKYETKIIEDCEMEDYFIVNYRIVKRAVEEYNATITRSGRGSGCSFLLSKFLGLSEVDRIKSPITLYPTRFMSSERIKITESLPDYDINCADSEPLVKAAKDILGEDGVYPMVAYKTLKESGAFRLWCKALDYNFEEYNEIAKNIDEYVDHPKWSKVIEDSKVFVGVIDSISPSPCSFLIYDKPITEEIGLIRLGKENGDGSVICCCLDKDSCDTYKYLKEDFLIVSVYSIIAETYKLLNRDIDSIEQLMELCDDDVWKMYELGLTETINQCDSDYAKQTLKKYKPKSLAELSAWVAAIRPGFKSLLDNFIERKPYSTGVKELDNILQDSFHYLMYQESIMKYLVWLGVKESGTYDIIKKISKKKFTHEEQEKLKAKLLKGWILNVGKEEGFEETWQVVEDAAKYSFNSSHSLCVAIDSIYGAYLKSHYPLEYYSVVFSQYDKDKSKMSYLSKELDYFGIKTYPVKFGLSGAKYTIDYKNNALYKGVGSIKYCNEIIANELYELGTSNKYSNFVELLFDIKKHTGVNKRQIIGLIKLDYFKEFGENGKLLKIYDIFSTIGKRKTISKKDIESGKISISEMLIKKYSNKETDKQYSDIDMIGLLGEYCNRIENKEISIQERVRTEVELQGYTTYAKPKLSKKYYIVTEFNAKYDPCKPLLTLHNLNNGEEIKCSITSKKIFMEEPFEEYSILEIDSFAEVDRKRKDESGKWVPTGEKKLTLTDYKTIVERGVM